MPYNFPNQPSVLPRLNAPIDDAVTSLTVDSWTYEDTQSLSDFVIKIDNEYMFVGARSGNTLSSITRNSEQPGAAAAHVTGAIVRCVFTRAAILDIASAVSPLVLIHDSTIVTPVASITISGIPASYKHLQAILHFRGSGATTFVVGNLRINGDSGANYDLVQLFTTGATEDGVGVPNTTGVTFAGPANAAPANTFGLGRVFIPDYLNAQHKSINYQYDTKFGTGATSFQTLVQAAWWRNTAAITELSWILNSGNFMAGTRLTLYGMN